MSQNHTLRSHFCTNFQRLRGCRMPLRNRFVSQVIVKRCFMNQDRCISTNNRKCLAWPCITGIRKLEALTGFGFRQRRKCEGNGFSATAVINVDSLDVFDAEKGGTKAGGNYSDRTVVVA